jgi:hypothetical protein
MRLERGRTAGAGELAALKAAVAALRADIATLKATAPSR